MIRRQHTHGRITVFIKHGFFNNPHFTFFSLFDKSNGLNHLHIFRSTPIHSGQFIRVNIDTRVIDP